jgi:gluconate 2-dehydrogenase gamma chain
MSRPGFSRRDFIASIAGASAATWVSASWSDLHAAGSYAATAALQERWQVLTPDQVRELDAVTAQLVPTDDTPGAREAHVVRFVDRSLATWAQKEKPAFAAAMKKLDQLVASHFPGATSFAALGDAEQITVLKDWEATDRQTFGWVHGATISGMFCNPEYGGNYNKTGWKLLGFKDQFSWAPPFGYYDRA